MELDLSYERGYGETSAYVATTTLSTGTNVFFLLHHSFYKFDPFIWMNLRVQFITGLDTPTRYYYMFVPNSNTDILLEWRVIHPLKPDELKEFFHRLIKN